MNDLTEQRSLLADSVDRLFGDLMESGPTQAEYDAVASGVVPAALWRGVEENGITGLFVSETDGGFGGSWEDAFVVLHRAGYFCVPLPIAETLVAQRLLARSGIAIPAGPMAIAATTETRLEREAPHVWRLHGSAPAVPWGNAAKHVLVVCSEGGSDCIALVAKDGIDIVARGHTIAREPLADLRFDGVVPTAVAAIGEDVFALCALARVAQIAGALSVALERSVQYANERIQFGKPIGKFQAIQHALAQLAGEAAAVNCAALAACRAADRSQDGSYSFEIAAAKLRANRAVPLATSIAHQVHGAIGFTREHKLHLATQRLWSWRSEYGNDHYWATRLGGLVALLGEDLWRDLTARSDAHN